MPDYSKFPELNHISPNNIVCISGGFDPLHIGHCRLITEAAMHGNVWVILNSDEWLQRKKGYVFMPWNQRREILMTMRGVENVISVDDSDGTVCAALKLTRPKYFANGGDRTPINTPELTLCEQLGITPLFNIGGEKIASSSELVGIAKNFCCEAKMHYEITGQWSSVFKPCIWCMDRHSNG